VVVIPCWNRADFLWACLHRLSIADGAADYRYLISIDRKHSVEVQNVAHDFRNLSQLSVRIIDPGDHPFHGNSFNVLHAYRMATEMTAGLIHLIEEDIFVAKSYFRFAEAAHALVPDCFGVSACRDQNDNPPTVLVDSGDPDPESWVFERPTYQSLAVSFRSEVVRRFVQMVTPDYFASPVETLARWFPNTRIPRGQAEQDGFIGRVLEDVVNGMGATGMIYPLVPRAAHYGFAGYNRSNGRHLVGGSIEDRGKRLLAMTADELNAQADPSYRDIRPIALDAAEADPLVLRNAGV
jgi:hypothetical protein